MWLKHANSVCELWKESASGQVFRGFHDGYLRLDDPVRHSREIRYTAGERVLTIEDVLECGGHHIVEHFWHFHPDCKVDTDGSGRLDISCGEVRVRMTSLASGSLAEKSFRGSISPTAGWYSPKFGKKVPTTTVCWRREVDKSSTFSTDIEIIVPC
jgi:hypothetical protein